MLKSISRILNTKNVKNYSSVVNGVIQKITDKDPHEVKFHQAFSEIAESLKDVIEADSKYLEILEYMAEPERVIEFRVPWIDDAGELVYNRGYRVQYNSALGPYKGGIRFDPSVDLGTLKFLGFEQILKNALTGLPMGGAKGGSNFDPKGKSENEVMRFCQSFMTELQRHVGSDTDVPAGDIGVGGREVAFMYGQFKRIQNVYDGGVLTGKGPGFGGSLLRPEATGYGLVWFSEEMLKTVDDDLSGKRVITSGAGNVTMFCAELLLEKGAIPLTLSDRVGTVYFPEGMTMEHVEYLKDLKVVRFGDLSEMANDFAADVEFYEGEVNVFDLDVKADIALPCARENEIYIEQAENLVTNGVWLVAEGANMPSRNESCEYYHANNVMYGPAKAANCGGVACSGLEMVQNSIRYKWTREEVTEKLHMIMVNCHDLCYQTSVEFGDKGNLQMGANIAGFKLVADAMICQGHV